jgi:calnexin
MQHNILFDNIYIGHSVGDANALKAETWDLKIAVEKDEDKDSKPWMDDKPKSPSDLKFMDDPVTFIKEKADLFLTIAKNDPIQAFKFVPEAGIALGSIVAIVLAIVVAVAAGSPAAPSKADVKGAAKKAANKAAEAKDKAAEAVSSGAEKAQTEVQKRATRSSEKS